MFRIHSSIAQDFLKVLLLRLDDGPGHAKLHLFEGGPPKSVDVRSSNAPIGSIKLLHPPGEIVEGLLELNFVTDAVAVRSGKVEWARLVSALGRPIFDCDVAVMGATLELNYAEFIVGGPIVVRRLIIVQPTQTERKDN